MKRFSLKRVTRKGVKEEDILPKMPEKIKHLPSFVTESAIFCDYEVTSSITPSGTIESVGTNRPSGTQVSVRQFLATINQLVSTVNIYSELLTEAHNKIHELTLRIESGGDTHG